MATTFPDHALHSDILWKSGLDASYFGISLQQWGDGVIFSSSNQNMNIQVFEF